MHPPEEILLDVASGEADLPQRVLIEGHLATCLLCRDTVAELARPGGAWLAGFAEEPVSEDLWQRVLAGIERPAPPIDPLAGLPLPAGARAELAAAQRWEDGAPRWRSVLASSARYVVLARDAGTGSFLVAAHLPPARTFPLHFHPSREEVLVLSGGYADDLGLYEAGDYALYAPGTCHRPATEEDEACWILTRLEAPIRFLGWRGWLQRLFA